MTPSRHPLLWRWALGLLLCGLILLVARRSGGEVLATLETTAVDPEEPFEGPEDLAARVRYSDPFEVDAGVLVVEAEGRADVLLSLVEETRERPPMVAEATLRLRGRDRARFAGVEPGAYRLRVIAEGQGPVRLRVRTGAVSPFWAVLAAALALLPALLATRQWMRARNLR